MEDFFKCYWWILVLALFFALGSGLLGGGFV